jgi:DNA-binding protein HU-beta
MNKGQLIEAVAAELDMSKAAASRAVDAVVSSITTGIKADDSVTIVGFGSFAKKKRAARTVRNPSTGEPIEIKATTTVGFKPSAALKEEMVAAGVSL